MCMEICKQTDETELVGLDIIVQDTSDTYMLTDLRLCRDISLYFTSERVTSLINMQDSVT